MKVSQHAFEKLFGLETSFHSKRNFTEKYFSLEEANIELLSVKKKGNLQLKRRHSLAAVAVAVEAAAVMVVVVPVAEVVMQTYFQLLSHQLLYTPGRYLLCVLRPCQRLCRLFLLFLLFVGLGAATPAPRWGVAEPKLVGQLCIALGRLPGLLTSERVKGKLYYVETWS